MADSIVIKKLDARLVEDGVVDKSYLKDYKKVHDYMNKEVRKYNKSLKEEDFTVGEEDLRKWLNTLYKQGASQEKLTSYTRVGLAHLCFDFIRLKHENDLSKDDQLKRALQSFKKRGYNKSYFKPTKS